MPRVTGWLRIVQQRDRWGRPVDPGYGVDEGMGEVGGEHPDNELPPSWGRPIDPGFGNRPGRPGQLPIYGGGRPVDPDYGVGDGPIHPIDPEGPDNALPPGTIIPPLPPDLDIGASGKAYLSVTLIYQGQRHHHHIVVTIPETLPEEPMVPQPKRV